MSDDTTSRGDGTQDETQHEQPLADETLESVAGGCRLSIDDLIYLPPITTMPTLPTYPIDESTYPLTDGGELL